MRWRGDRWYRGKRRRRIGKSRAPNNIQHHDYASRPRIRWTEGITSPSYTTATTAGNPVQDDSTWGLYIRDDDRSLVPFHRWSPSSPQLQALPRSKYDTGLTPPPKAQNRVWFKSPNVVPTLQQILYEMASRYASTAALLVVVAVVFLQATSAAYLVPEGKSSPANPWRVCTIVYIRYLG